MADDGLVVNFSIGHELLKSKSTFKGGKWRDRLQAKKSLQRHKRNAETNDPRTGSNTTLSSSKSVAEKDNQERPAKRHKINFRDARPTETGGDVVSSLFTSNPASTIKSTTAPTASDVEHERVSPSNAPLSAAAYNFASLGVSGTLAEHLHQSLKLTAPTAIQRAALTKLLSEDPAGGQDAFIQAETGSGKTLAYLLPIIQRLTQLNASSSSNPPNSSTKRALTRKSGLFALILSPTRELTAQITDVLSRLLNHPQLRNIVAGSVAGGTTKNHEKARLRKGLNILVATPGRLVDHLEHTAVLELGKVKWLVLDEGDRLMELGFEEDLKKILRALDAEPSSQSSRVAGKADLPGEPGQDSKLKAREEDDVEGLPVKRNTILCSATMKMSVQRLGEMSLKDAVHIQPETVPPPMVASQSDHGNQDTASASNAPSGSLELSNSRDPIPLTSNGADSHFRAPSQLQQSCLIVPPKQRLVALLALLRQTFARRGTIMKVIVFLSCADSVDFHFELLRHNESSEGGGEVRDSSTGFAEETESSKMNLESKDKDEHDKSRELDKAQTSAHRDLRSASTNKHGLMRETKTSTNITSSPAPLLSPSALDPIRLFRLHGSLPQHQRSSTLRSFSTETNPSLLLATDVASRGLDVPNVDLVVEYDPAFSAEEHLHRVGRTARAGRSGRSIVFLMPGKEEGYLQILEGRRPTETATTTMTETTETKPSSIVKDTTNKTSAIKIEHATSLLQKVFSSSSSTSDANKNHRPSSHNGKSKSNWDTLATDYQLDTERWILSSPAMAELARKAFVSHVRAYATHIVFERGCFDVKDLHLGHLAKAFALREKPGHFGRGVGGGNGRGDAKKKHATIAGKQVVSSVSRNRSQQQQQQQKQQQQQHHSTDSAVASTNVDTANGKSKSSALFGSDDKQAALKMRMKMKEIGMKGAGAAEFNIG